MLNAIKLIFVYRDLLKPFGASLCEASLANSDNAGSFAKAKMDIVHCHAKTVKLYPVFVAVELYLFKRFR